MNDPNGMIKYSITTLAVRVKRIINVCKNASHFSHLTNSDSNPVLIHPTSDTHQSGCCSRGT